MTDRKQEEGRKGGVGTEGMLFPFQKPSQNLHITPLPCSLIAGTGHTAMPGCKVECTASPIKSGFDYEGRREEKILEWVSIRLCHRTQFPQRERESQRGGALTHSRVASVRTRIFIWFWNVFPRSEGFLLPVHPTIGALALTLQPAGGQGLFGLSVPTTLL